MSHSIQNTLLQNNASAFAIAMTATKPANQHTIDPLFKQPLRALLPDGDCETIWPSEHTGLWHSRAVSGVGLPENFDPAQLIVSGATLQPPASGYTRATAMVKLPSGIPADNNALGELIPGSNCMVVTDDPFETQTLVHYDPANSLLSAHTVLPDGSLTSQWDINGVYKVSASPVIVPDRDLLYINNYQNGKDSLVVLRLSSGEELASVPVDANLPTIGTIFLGMNGDVYILNSEAGSENGLISRIFLGPDQK